MRSQASECKMPDLAIDSSVITNSGQQLGLRHFVLHKKCMCGESCARPFGCIHACRHHCRSSMLLLLASKSMKLPDCLPALSLD